MRRLLAPLAVAVLLVATPAHAHKVIASVFPSGDVIEGEIGFSNGDMAVGALVEVFDEAGDKLGETRTDADGFFTYKPTRDVGHVFRSNLGAGHVAETSMSAADITAIMGKDRPQTEQASASAETVSSSEVASTTVVVASLTAEEREAIAEAVRDEARSLRREIAAYKEKNDLQTILGGLGYIAGLFGLGFYLAARRKLQG